MSRTCTQIELIFRIGDTGIDTPLTSNREGFERLFGAPDPRSVSIFGCRLRRLEIGLQQVERLLPHGPPIPRHRFGRVVGDVHGGLRPFRIEFVRYRGHHGSILFCKRPRKGELPRTLDRRDRRLKSSIRKRRLIHAAGLGIDADVVPPLLRSYHARPFGTAWSAASSFPIRLSIRSAKSAGTFPSATKLPSNCLDFARFCVDSYQNPQSSARRSAMCPASIASRSPFSARFTSCPRNSTIRSTRSFRPIRWICSFSRTMSVREIVGESSSKRPLPGFFPNRTSWLNSSRSRKMSTWNRFWPS